MNSAENKRVSLIKPKKHFQSASERAAYEAWYQSKTKTEMCKNWELNGSCCFGAKCSFAHGKSELVQKKHYPENAKTVLCASFYEKGFCSYASRCRFIHSECNTIRIKSSYSELLAENVRFSQQRAQLLGLTQVVYVNAFVLPRKRLPVFAKITSKKAHKTAAPQVSA